MDVLIIVGRNPLDIRIVKGGLKFHYLKPGTEEYRKQFRNMIGSGDFGIQIETPEKQFLFRAYDVFCFAELSAEDEIQRFIDEVSKSDTPFTITYH
jgi:hypothetical protein